jgi:hypothetical protein
MVCDLLKWSEPWTWLLLEGAMGKVFIVLPIVILFTDIEENHVVSILDQPSQTFLGQFSHPVLGHCDGLGL